MKPLITLLTSLFIIALAPSGFTQTAATGLSGKVVETMDGGGYTYVLVDSGTNKLWAAANKFSAKVGDNVTIPDAMRMEQFESKALKRTFPVIYFASAVTVNGGQPAPGGLPAGHPPMGQASALEVTGIKPAPGGQTVATIYAERTKLGGKTVQVRGKVVKFNANIMNKNWLHLQDGTGTPGSNDLLVTSTNTAKRGDTVLIEGVLVLDKDFGSGYKYELLVENAKVKVE